MSVENEIAGDCIGVRLRRLNRIVTSLYDEALRPFGLRLSQLNILVLATLHEPARPAELCRMLELDPSTLSRNLQILHRNGWIEYLEDSGDARAQPLRVTMAGHELIERAHPAWSFAQQQVEEALGPEVCRALRDSWTAG